MCGVVRASSRRSRPSALSSPRRLSLVATCSDVWRCRDVLTALSSLGSLPHVACHSSLVAMCSDVRRCSSVVTAFSSLDALFPTLPVARRHVLRCAVLWSVLTSLSSHVAARSDVRCHPRHCASQHTSLACLSSAPPQCSGYASSWLRVGRLLASCHAPLVQDGVGDGVAVGVLEHAHEIYPSYAVIVGKPVVVVRTHPDCVVASRWCWSVVQNYRDKIVFPIACRRG
eukprot:Opistho-1_new@30704